MRSYLRSARPLALNSFPRSGHPFGDEVGPAQVSTVDRDRHAGLQCWRPIKFARAGENLSRTIVSRRSLSTVAPPDAVSIERVAIFVK